MPGNDSGGGGASHGWWWGCSITTENLNAVQPRGSPWGLIADAADDWKIKAEHVRRVQRDVAGCGHGHHGPVDRERADRGHEQPLRGEWQPDDQRDDQHVREGGTGWSADSRRRWLIQYVTSGASRMFLQTVRRSAMLPAQLLQSPMMGVVKSRALAGEH